MAGAEPFAESFASAKRAMADGLWDVASSKLQAISSDPSLSEKQSIERDLALVPCLIRLQRSEEALKILDVPKFQAHQEAPFWKGQALAGMGRFSEAATQLHEVAANASLSFRQEAAFTAANLWVSLSQEALALESLALIDTPESKLRQVAILLDQGEAARARALFQEVKKMPKAWENFSQLVEAYLLRAEKKEPEALALFTKLLAQTGSISSSHLNQALLGKADALVAISQKDEALELLLTSLEAQEAVVEMEPVFRRIVVWMPEKFTSRELPIFQKLQEWLPESFVSAENSEKEGSAEALVAQPELEKWTEREIYSMYALAHALHRLDSPEGKLEAEGMLKRLKALAPEHDLVPSIWLTWATWKGEEEKWEEAFTGFDMVAKTSASAPMKGRAAFMNAQMAYQNGDLAKASELFRQASQQLKEEEQVSAAFNSNLSKILLNPETSLRLDFIEPEAASRLKADLEIERALSAKQPSERIRWLDVFLRSDAAHPRNGEARLHISEAALLLDPPDLLMAKAQVEALRASKAPLSSEHVARLELAQLKIFDLSNDKKSAEAQVLKISELFPNQPVAGEAFFLLGLHLYRTGDYNQARIYLEKSVALKNDPGSAPVAYLIAARCAALGATEQSREEALSLYDLALQQNPALHSLVALEKARLLIEMNRFSEGIDGLRKLYQSLEPSDPSYFFSGILLAEAIYAQAEQDPSRLSETLEICHQLLKSVEKDSARSFQLMYLKGMSLERLLELKGASASPKESAREVYYSALDRPKGFVPVDWEWFELMGFRLMTLLESEEDWHAAISIAEKMASFQGPRAEEAKARAKQIRLKYMIWEE